MRTAIPRVAYFPDTFYEINGVAHTSRHFEAFARRRNIPFFCLHPAKKDSAIQEQQQGELTTLEIPRGSAISFRIEKDLTFDAAFCGIRSSSRNVCARFAQTLCTLRGLASLGFSGLGWRRISRFRW